MTVAQESRASPPRPSRPAYPRRGVLRDGPHRPPPAHRRTAVHGEVHGADPRRRRTPARADLRRTAPPRPWATRAGAAPRSRADKTDAVRTAYLEGRYIAALARAHDVSRGAIRTAVADLL